VTSRSLKKNKASKEVKKETQDAHQGNEKLAAIIDHFVKRGHIHNMDLSVRRGEAAGDDFVRNASKYVSHFLEHHWRIK
jgi:hypothetical protein